MKDNVSGLPLIVVEEIPTLEDVYERPRNLWKESLEKEVNRDGKESSFNSNVKITDKVDYVPFRVK